MGKLLVGLIVLGLVVGVAGAALASWNIPAPSAHIEKALPDEAFPR
jgi:hypothetical protein